MLTLLRARAVSVAVVMQSAQHIRVLACPARRTLVAVGLVPTLQMLALVVPVS
tara:strand:- start:73 stop:231 length:159 start_codon:yes stop_codon:yes gene_type:complete